MNQRLKLGCEPVRLNDINWVAFSGKKWRFYADAGLQRAKPVGTAAAGVDQLLRVAQHHDMNVQIPPSSIEGIISANQAQMREGQRLSLKEVLFPPQPQDGLLAFETLLQLEGAVLILAFLHDGQQHIFGTAALVAPGIAITAGHVIREHQGLGHIDGEKPALYCFGPAPDHMHIWWTGNIIYSVDGDIAVLILEYATEMPGELQVSYFATCARLPHAAERVAAVGFRPVVEGHLGHTEGVFLTSSGPVADVYPTGRDAMLPRPSFAAALTTIGAMSGGPVLNAQGKQIGIITSSIDPFEDEPAVTFATLLWDGLAMRVQATWPPTFWPNEPKPLRDLLTPEDGWRLHWSPDLTKFRYQASGDGPHPSFYESFEEPDPL